MGKIKNLSISIVLILISIILTILSLNQNAERFGISNYGHDLFLLILLFFLSLYIIFKSSGEFKRTTLDSLAIILALSSLPSFFFDESKTSESLLYGILQFSFIPIGLMFGRSLASSVFYTNKKNKLLILFMSPAIVTCVLFSLFQTQIEVGDIRDFIFMVVIYLPYLLFIDNRFVKPLLVILFLFVIFLSVKRTALLSGLLFLIFLILIQLTKSKRLVGKLGTWFGITIIALVSFFIISRNYSESAEVVVERFAAVEDDGGSGRDVVYDVVLDGISQSDIDGVIFGNGYGAVSKKLLGHPAHNEFLEITYDNGIIVVIFYIIFIILLIRQVIKRKRLKQQYLILLFCILNYLLVSSLNCVITNPVFIFVIMTSIGLSLGVTNYSSVLDNEKIS